jgi:hypothetical protein
MLGRHSPTEPQIFFPLAVLGFELRSYVCKVALYCLSHTTSPFTILIFSVDLLRGLPVPL